MNLGEAKNRALKLIAEWSNNGNLISASSNADYTLRMNSLADTAQKEIATVKKIPAIHYITQNLIPNQLGLLYAFDLKQHLKDDIIDVAVGSKAYYFEVDNVADIYIEENVSGTWNTLITINNTVKKQFTTYKGKIPISDANNQVRVRYSGSYPYNIKNRALYEYDFPTDADVPDYSPYVKYVMPDDFMALEKVIWVHDSMLYQQAYDYFWENKKTLVANYFMYGTFQVHYFKYPTTIDDNTADSYSFEVDLEAQELIPYYLAAHVSMDEPQKQNMVSTYLNMYNNKLANLDANNHYGTMQIENIYNW